MVGERELGRGARAQRALESAFPGIPSTGCQKLRAGRCRVGLGGREILTMELTPEGGVPTCSTEASPLRCDAHSQGPMRGPSLESEGNR